LNIEGTSATSERRSTPMEGHMCRWAMASWVGLPSMLSLTSSTFRDGHVLARRDLGAGPTCGTFHQIGHPAVNHSHQQSTAYRAGVNQSPYHYPVDAADKTPASTLTHFRSSPHHASTPPHHHNSVQQSDQVTLLLQPTLFLESTRLHRTAVTTATFPN
jgi:hypothetical protein